MKINKMRSLRAVTLTELLVVLAIISLLATLAVPVFVSQMQRARYSVAQAEVREIAEAEQMAAIVHGFYFPIHVLDNVPNRPSGSGVGGASTDRDDFENLTGVRYVIDATLSLEEQVNGNGGTAPQIQLLTTGNSRIARAVQSWQGPFLNPKRVVYVGSTASVQGSGDLHADLVIDPWGNPYRFYTDLGLVGSAGLPSASNETAILGMDDGRLNISGPEVDRFDRFAIVSYGPDGISGFNGNSLVYEDDIFYTFSGVAGNETTYQGF
ncbi:hypothetical protein BH09SUM1_BH09SUM1_02050 [soil metagenome]